MCRVRSCCPPALRTMRVERSGARPGLPRQRAHVLVPGTVFVRPRRVDVNDEARVLRPYNPADMSPSASPARSVAELRRHQLNAVVASFLGWTFDAFDFF